MRKLLTRALRACLTAGAALLVITCTDNPVGPGRPGLGSLRVAPTFDAFARNAPLTLDNVRVLVVRPPSDTVARVARSFSVSSTQLTLNIPLQLQAASEDLEVTLELYAGTTLLFSGTRIVRVAQGLSPAPDSVPVVYQGPGASIAAITIGPRDTTVVFGGSFLFGATAVDSQQAPVASFYVGWTASAGTIDAAGQFTAPAARDTVTVTATTPSGITDQTTVIVAAAPATLVKVSGDNQSGIIGSRLALPLVVRVDGSDGLPVAGVPVTFAATTGGGSVDSATVVSDGAGLAPMGATLGGTVGAQSFTATAPGLTAVVFAATGTGGAAKTWTGTLSGDWNTAGNWSPAAVPVTTDSVAIPAGTPNAPALGGNATIRTLLLLGTGTNLDLSGTLTVSGLVSLPDSNSFINVSSGALVAGSLSLGGFQAFVDARAGGMTVSGATTVSGNRAFVDATGTGPNSFGAVTLSGAQAFLQHGGGTSGPISLSSSALWEATGPVTVSGSPAASVQGVASLSTTGAGPAPVVFNGDVVLGGADGRLIPNTADAGFTINGNLLLTGSGRLEMLQATDTVRVNGSVSFGGADETGSLTAGALFVSGNFTQTGVSTSFVGSGGHTVFLNGAGAQTLNFASPGFAAARFHNVIIANSAGGVTATSDLYATGTAGVTPTAVRTLSGNGSTLFTTILNVSNFTFNNLLLNFTGSTVVTFDTVSFTGYAPTATPLTIAHPGAAAPLAFLDVSFSVVPTSGFYLSATDTNPTDGVPLVIDMLSPSPLSNGGRVATAGGATVNWPAGAQPGTWTGVVDTSWNTAGNWSDGQVPTATTDVTIPAGTPFAPFTSGTVRPTRNLTVQPGATLTIGGGGLNVNGSLDAAGLITGNVASFALVGTGTARGTVTGTFFSITVNGSYTLNGRLVASGITVNGTLTLNGNTALVGSSAGDDFQTVNNGRLVMTSPLDSLIIGGANSSITFNGGSTAGVLSAGVILMNGSAFTGFTQNNTFNDSSYAPSGSHKVVLATGATLALDFATPGAGSHFNILDISAQTPGFSLSTPIRVNGLFVSTPAATAPAITGSNRLLTAAGGTQVTGLTLTNTLFSILGAGPVQFDNVRFQSMNIAATQLTIAGPGSAGPVVLNNTVFATQPTGGFYLNATDTDGIAPFLTVNLVGATPATPGSFTQVSGGAAIGWPPAAPAKTWTGASNTDWNTASNWSPAGVPTLTDPVVVPVTANQPVLAQNVILRQLTVQAGAAVNLSGFTLFADSALNLSTTPGFTGSGTVALTGAVGAVQGNLGPATPVLAQGGFRLTGRTVVGNLTISGSGDMTTNGQTLVVSGSLVTTGSGTLTMNSAADSVLVAGNATFGGGSASGRLVAGVLSITGDFAQLSGGGFGATFSTGGTHKTIFPGGTVRTVNFNNPGTGAASSHFQDLDLSATTGELGTNSPTLWVVGTLTSRPGGAAPVVASNGGLFAGLQVRGGIDVTGLTLDSVSLDVRVPAITTFNNVVFSNQNPTGTQLLVDTPGQAAAYGFNNLQFLTAANFGLGGVYLRATDTDGIAPFLTLNMVNPVPVAPTEFLTFNGAVVNWPAAAPTFGWTGAVSTDWFTAGNWSSGVVPGPTSDVTIGTGSPNAPVLNASTTVNSLTFTGSVVLNLGGGAVLTLNGSLDATAGQIQGSGPGATEAVQLAGDGTTLQGSIQFANLFINGRTSVVGIMQVFGSAVLTDTLDLTNQLLIATDFTATGPAALILSQQPGAQLSVLGNATFDGGNQLGSMSDGVVSVAGNFTQLATHSGDSYHPSGNHLTVINSAGNSVVSFATPGTVPGTSHFQELAIAGTALDTVTFASDAYAHGNLQQSNADTTFFKSGDRTLSLGGASFASAVVFDNTRLVINASAPGSILFLGSVGFRNMNPLATQLSISEPGSIVPLTLTNATFTTLPTAGGFYLSATDTDGPAVPFTIELVNPSPATPGPFAQALNGAVINWPAAGPVITWTGAVSSDWFTAGNWSNSQVPSSTDSIVIVATPNDPVLTGLAIVQAVEIQGGTLVLNGQAFGTTGSFRTTGSGTITMTNAADSLDIGGDADFSGGIATGLITAGVIQVGGNFTQGGTPAAPGFEGSGTNVVRLVGGASAVTTVGSNLATVFHTLELATSGPVVLVSTSSGLNFDGTGALRILTPVPVTYFSPGVGAVSFNGGTSTVAGSSMDGPFVSLFPGSTILGTWTVDTTGWSQGAALQLQVPNTISYNHLVLQQGNNFFFDPGTFTIPGSLITRVVNAGTIRVRDTLGARTLLSVGGTTQAFGRLTLDGGKLSTASLDVATLGGSRGFLVMQTAADSVIVSGDAAFGGGSTVGLLTAGVLQVQGNFSQASATSVASFAPSGTHRTLLGASGARTVTFASPGAGAAGSHFQVLDMTAASGGLTLASSAIVDSALVVNVAAGAPKLVGGGNSLTARQWLVQGMDVDNAPMILNEQGTILPQTFNSVTFAGFPTTATTAILMNVTAVGSAATSRPIQFNNLSVQTSLGSGGLYARLVTGGLNATLTINGSNDPTGGPSRSDPPFGTTVAGARIVWQ